MEWVLNSTRKWLVNPVTFVLFHQWAYLYMLVIVVVYRIHSWVRVLMTSLEAFISLSGTTEATMEMRVKQNKTNNNKKNKPF